MKNNLMINKNDVSNTKFKNPLFVYEFGLYKIPMLPCGTWPLQKQNIFSYFFFLLSFSMQFAAASTLGLELIYNCASTIVTIDYVGLGVCAILAFIKTATVWLNTAKFVESFRSAADDWFNVTDKKYIKIMKKHARISRFVFFGQLYSTYVSATNIAVGPMIAKLNSDIEENLLPLQTTCTISNLTGWVYKPVYVVQSIQVYFIGTGNIGHDVFFISLVMHICAQLQIFEVELQKIGSDANAKGCWRRIEDLLRRHQHLLALNDILDKAFWIMLLIQLTLSGIVLTILGIEFLVALREHDASLMIKNGLFAGIVLLQLFLYCYFGDYLEWNYAKIATGIYSSQWYTMSPKVLKNIIFAMMKSNRTVQLKAGKLFDINKITFTSVLKMMMSMFSVVRMMFNK